MGGSDESDGYDASDNRGRRVPQTKADRGRAAGRHSGFGPAILASAITDLSRIGRRWRCPELHAVVAICRKL